MAGRAQHAEIHFRARGKDIIRKKVPRNGDAGLQEHRHLAALPYNLSNKLITEPDVRAIFARLGVDIPVRDLSIYQLAFVHRSYLREALQAPGLDDTSDLTPEEERDACIPLLVSEGYLRPGHDATGLMPLREESSERLEYLGDAVCGLSVASYLYHRYPDQDEGFMTRLRTRIVCGSKLGEFADKLGLAEFAIISRYVEIVNTGRSNYKVLEDVFEAFIGAVFEDNDRDFAVCDRLLVKILETYVDFSDTIRCNNNFKDELLQAYQKYFDGAFPRYKEIDVETVNGVKIYTVGVLSPDGKQVVATARHPRKRSGEQAASARALEFFGWIEDAGDPEST